MSQATCGTLTDHSDRKTYRVEDIILMLDISRSAAYRLIREKPFQTKRIGASIRILRSSFDEWLEQQNN